MSNERRLPGDLFTDGLDGDLTVTSDPAENYVANIAGRNYLVDGEAGRVQFLDSRFYRDPESGVFVPSVTTVLEAYPKGAQYYEWLKKHGQDADEIRDEAGRRGSVVHEATEVLDLGGELELMSPDGSPRYKLSEWAMISRYVEFRERFPARMHAVETKLACGELGYAGTLDRLMTFEETGETFLVDIKTSGSVWQQYWLQQAAYHELLHVTGAIAKMFPDGEVPEVKLAILWLNAKTRSDGKKGAIQGAGWQLITQSKPTPDLLRIFNNVRETWLMEHQDEQPRTTSYKLNLKINNRVDGDGSTATPLTTNSNE
jgi:hypothetical protein